MKTRCDNPNHERYSVYGGREISYDPRWKAFEPFLADMGEAPAGHVLGRKDHDKNYCLENCEWVPASKNSGERRRK